MGTSATPSALWPALIASLIPIVLGVSATYFRPFVDSRSEFRGRIKLRRQALLEKLAVMHAVLLRHAAHITEDELLRGDGRDQPDLVADYTSEVFRLFTVFHRLETIRLCFAIANTGLLVAVSAGVLGAFCAWLWSDSRTCVLVGGVAVVVVQMVLVCLIYWCSCKLESYEDTT